MAAGIAALLVLASALGIISKRLNQPALIGFIIAGMIASGTIDVSHETLSYMSEIGIIVLMFMIGLEMNLSMLRKAGPRILGFSLLSTAMASAAMMLLMGAFFKPDLKTAIALSFSSTAVVMEIIQKNRKSETVFGRAVLGALIIQDIIGVMLLSWSSMSLSSMSGILVVALAGVVLNRIIHPLLLMVRTDHDLLMLTGLSSALVMAILSGYAGLSPALGSFIAGLLINPSMFSPMVEESIKSIKAFFMSLFFVSVGLEAGMPASLAKSVAFLAAATATKFAINYVSSLVSGFRKREALEIGLSLSGFSEFLLIVMVSEGYSEPSIVFAAILSFIVSGVIENNLDEILSMLHLKKRTRRGRRFDIVIFGCHRTGHKIAEYLKSRNADFVVVDSNPEVVERLKMNGINAVFGNMNDPSLLEQINLRRAKLIISTIPVFKYNMKLAKEYPKARKVCVARTPHEALDLYKAGMDYVVIPEVSGGSLIIEFLKKRKSRKQHIMELTEKIKKGML